MKEMESASLQIISQNLERRSTQIEKQNPSIQEAAILASEGEKVQNNAAELKHRASRKAGKGLNDIEQKEGWKKRKEVQKELNIPFNLSRRWQKEAQVEEKDFELYLEKTRQKNKEITNSGVARAGKEIKKSVLVSAAVKVLQKLSLWLNSRLLKSLTKKYAGSAEELKEAATLLEKLSEQFAATAKLIRETQA